ncbi:hypothetical protein BaRGS_00007477, partial [Batillaria attramentaria]
YIHTTWFSEGRYSVYWLLATVQLHLTATASLTGIMQILPAVQNTTGVCMVQLTRSTASPASFSIPMSTCVTGLTTTTVRLGHSPPRGARSPQAKDRSPQAKDRSPQPKDRSPQPKDHNQPLSVRNLHKLPVKLAASTEEKETCFQTPPTVPPTTGACMGALCTKLAPLPCCSIPFASDVTGLTMLTVRKPSQNPHKTQLRPQLRGQLKSQPKNHPRLRYLLRLLRVRCLAQMVQDVEMVCLPSSKINT